VPEVPRGRYDELFTQVYRPLFLAIQPQLQRLARLRGGREEGSRRP